MAAPPKLIAATVYLPGGEVKRYEGDQIPAWGILDNGAPLLLVAGAGGRMLRYAGFPVIFELEPSVVEVVSRLDVGV